MPPGTLLSLLLASLVLASSPEAAHSLAPSLSRTQLTLLANSRYQVRADGTVWGPDGRGPYEAKELAYLLRRIESAQRLKALLQINLILGASDGEKNLSPTEREQIRAILRESWPLYPLATRKKFRAYFSLEELEGLNRDPAPVDADLAEPPPLSDMVPETQTILAAAAPPAADLHPSAQPAAAAAASLAALQAALAMAPSAAPAAAIPTAAIPAAALPAAAPPPAAAPAPAAVAAPVLAPVPSAEPAPAPPPAAEAATSVPEVGSAEFEKFLLEAPFTREAKSLLRLIARKAPPFARSRALNAAMKLLPQIVFDAGRAGGDLRGSLLVERSGDAKGYTIALSPGPAVRVRRRLFGKDYLLLPQGAEAAKALALPPLAAEATRKDAVAEGEEKGPWGQTRRYADGSLRGAFSYQQQAGTLLRLLLRLDARDHGWDAWPFGVESYSRTAMLLFYSAVEDEAKGVAFLDPALEQSYRHWLERPAEERDHWFHAWTSARVRALDPHGPDSGPLAAAADGAGPMACEEVPAALKSEALKLEVADLSDAGLLENKAVEAARQALSGIPQGPPPSDAALCGRPAAALASGRRLARLLASEATQAELRFREELSQHEKSR